MRSYRGREQREPPDDAGRDVGVLRAGAARLAEGAPRRVARDLEDHRQRPAARPVVPDAPSYFEAVANGDDGAAARPRAGARRPAALHPKARRIRNVVWITADVHYCAAHHYHPSRAKFTEFDPFWEFVAGPLNAGTFGPNKLDATFGPEVKFTGIPPGMKPNRPPSDGLSVLRPAAGRRRTKAMTVTLHDLSGKTLFSQELAPVRTAFAIIRAVSGPHRLLAQWPQRCAPVVFVAIALSSVLSGRVGLQWNLHIWQRLNETHRPAPQSAMDTRYKSLRAYLPTDGPVCLRQTPAGAADVTAAASVRVPVHARSAAGGRR